MFGKSNFLGHEHSATIHADSVSFLTSTDDRVQKYSPMFGFSWTNPSMNSQWYMKNVCSDVALKSIITIWACKLFNSKRFVLSIPDTLLTFCFMLVSCKSAISTQSSSAHVEERNQELWGTLEQHLSLIGFSKKQ